MIMLQEFVGQVEETIQTMLNEVHTALPGKILSFSPEQNTAVIKPIGTIVMPDGKRLAYPELTDVPILFPFCSSAKVGMAFPVQQGDFCLIILSEIELDEWRSGATSEASLRFDLTSAIAIPGLLQSGGDLVSKACRQNAVVLGAGEKEIEISESGIICRGDLKIEGNFTCSGEVKAGKIGLQNHTHQSAQPGQSSSPPQ